MEWITPGHPLFEAVRTDCLVRFEDDLRRLPVMRLIDRIRATREDDAVRLEVADEFFGYVEGMHLAINLMLAHTAGNQLADLGAEIENEDFLV